MSADQRVLRGVPATLSWQPVDSDGDPTSPAGTVTVGVTTADGSVVVAAGTATLGSGAQRRTVALLAAQTAQLNRLTATWTDSGGGAQTTLIEIVGGYYFSTADAYRHPEIKAERFPPADVLAARTVIEDEWERITDAAFVPRYERETLTATGRCWLLLSHPLVTSVRSVRSYAADGTYTSYTAGQLAALQVERSGRITSRDSVFPSGVAGNIVIEYEHGYPGLPADGKPLALRHLRARLAGPSSAIPDRAERYVADGGGMMVLSMAKQYATGIPDVDAFLARYSMRVPGVA